MSNFLRILIISDLHFSDKQPTNVGGEKILLEDEDELNNPLNNPPRKLFFDKLDSICIDEQDKPKVIIVVGDIVDKGGRIEGSFEKAIKFLRKLAFKYSIDKNKVHIVPGNHDVLWDGRLSQSERFKTFLQSTAEFARPSIDNGKISPLEVVLNDAVTGINVRLLLLVSSALSGIKDKREKKATVDVDKLRNLISKAKKEGAKEDAEKEAKATVNVKELEALISDPEGTVDVAVIGRKQRKRIRNTGTHENTINIAVLHHNLLPSNSEYTEVREFDSMFDSGLVLNKLIKSKYDLAITGHKHSRNLVKYTNSSLADSSEDFPSIDIFSSPCLFREDGDGAGFAFLDVYGVDSPYYAKITTHRILGSNPGSVFELIREGRVKRKITENCIKVSPSDQDKYLNGVTSSIASALEWRHSRDFENRLSDLFNDSFGYSTVFLKNMSDKKIIIKSPFASNKWADFINAINKIHIDKNLQPNQVDLKVVSDNDIEYWNQALTNEKSDAYMYCKALAKFNGNKTRIWIVSKDYFKDKESCDNVEKIVKFMKKMSFNKIYKIYDEDAKKLWEQRDFSVIGNICVSQWLKMDESCDSRELVESFDTDYINSRKEEYKRLLSKSEEFKFK